jgi:hypothetical protein
MNDPSRKQELHGKTDKHARFVLTGVRSGDMSCRHQRRACGPFHRTWSCLQVKSFHCRYKLNFAGITGDLVIIEPAAKPSRDNVPINITPLPLSGGEPRPMQR